MKVDLSDVPESTVFAVYRLVQLSEEGHSGEVVMNLNDGGVSNVEERRNMGTSELRRLAGQEVGGTHAET